ncbi:MAG: fumarylacetoacetate hydrolase family protein [Acidimicrobiales bacterium]
MRLATIRTVTGTAAARIEGDTAVEIDGFQELSTLLGTDNWRHRASVAAGGRHDLSSVRYAPLVAKPDKIVCVGLNYRTHIIEMGTELPRFPTLFSKFACALIGANDDIAVPKAVERLDWEAELALVIGSAVRNASALQAAQAIGGYSVLNDVTARDWQGRTAQWLQGKTFEGCTPLGPHLVTPDEFDGTSGEITCHVNGELMQRSDIADLLFGAIELVAYVSKIVTLTPGDVIATGTPGGVGAARNPPVFLKDGDLVTTCVAGVGECSNLCRTSP